MNKMKLFTILNLVVSFLAINNAFCGKLKTVKTDDGKTFTIERKNKTDNSSPRYDSKRKTLERKSEREMKAAMLHGATIFTINGHAVR